MEGLDAMRQHGEGRDLVIEARLRGKGMPAVGEAARLMDRSIETLAHGARVEKSVVLPAIPQGEYREKFQDGWPN